MIAPACSGDAFLEDVAQARAAAGAFHVWWLGQSGFLVQWKDRRLLFDPYLSDSLTRKYAGTDTPHVRMTERVVAPGRLGGIDVVTSTHNHTDHLDAETLGPLREANPALQMVIPEANRAFVAGRLGCAPDWPVGLDDGAAAEIAGFTLTGVAAAHEELEQDEAGRYTHLGYVAEFGPWTLYHSGDTLWYDGLVERLRAWQIDVALLPINGQDHPAPGNLSGAEAARLARRAGARLVIPCHYDMFAFNTASPAPFMREAERLSQPYRVLRAGGRWSSQELEAPRT